MSRLGDIRERLAGVFVARRTAVLVAVPVPVVAFLPGVWGPIVATAWLAGLAWLVRRDLVAAGSAADISIQRSLPVKLSIGVSNPVLLGVRNSCGRTVVICGRETPPPGLAGDRAFGPIDVGPHSSLEVRLTFVPPARGSYFFGRVAVRTVGPAGLAGRQFEAGEEQEARVYPDITAVQQYALLARRGALHEIGVRAARFEGVGTEYESLREYQDGDGYGDIDWKATARRGKPVVRRFEAERSQTVVLAVDAGRLMVARAGTLSKLDRAINASLLLAFLATRAGDNVGLLVFGRDVRTYLPPRKGHRQFLAILEALYGVEGRVEEPDYAGALRYLATRLSKRALIVLFTELVGTEPSRRLLGVLASLAPRHLPLVVTQRSLPVEEMATQIPQGALSTYEAAVAEDILRDKAAAMRLLRARGSLVLDVVPERLSVASVNRYLEIKARGRL